MLQKSICRNNDPSLFPCIFVSGSCCKLLPNIHYSLALYNVAQKTYKTPFIVYIPWWHLLRTHTWTLSQQGYLRRFYNLNLRSRGRQIRSMSAMEEKTREMQNFFGLQETGHLDPHTLDVMREPRCGVPDVENFSFYPGKPKWKHHTITYMWGTRVVFCFFWLL